MHETALVPTIERLIDAGCHYRIDDLQTLYAPDLIIHIVQENGDVLTFDYEQNLAFFRSLRDAGAPPLNTAAHFCFAEEHNGIGFVTVQRTLDLGAGPKNLVFNLMLKKTPQAPLGWIIFREHAVITGTA